MKELNNLKQISNNIRKDIIKMVSEARSGHPAGALGMADIFTVLYFNIMNYDPKKPFWEDRDRLILSNGHICAVRYAAMARAGFFPIKEMLTFRKFNSRLQGHPSLKDLPGVDASSGSLGQGLSIAVGMALAAKLDKKDYKIYCVISDGELDEGSTWEAINAANKWKLDNLIMIIDRNNIQISGKTENVWPLEPLKKKLEAFNWEAIKIDGNNIESIIAGFERIKHFTNKPKVIIANTIPGKGVSFMENDSSWHGKVPSHAETQIALKELEND
jgi:transketolase